jgi:hypothetical protein
MTSQSPRIYIYKITFEEVLYYYYGVHKEKYFNEEYWGSPVTHKWMWDFYTPKKQTLEIFPFTDEGWLEAQEVEKRLIKPFYNTDKWCLNENCGGRFSIEHQRKSGQKGGKISRELLLGAHSIPGNQKYWLQKNKEDKIGIFSLSPEELSKYGKIGSEKAREQNVGIFAMTKEQRSEAGKKSNSQKWMCLETGYITTSGPLSLYQNKRGIDITKRVRVS